MHACGPPYALRLQVNVGKGGEWLLPFLCHAFSLAPERTAVVGDRMDTDIALGQQGGLRTVLPLTGKGSIPSPAPFDSASSSAYVYCGTACGHEAQGHTQAPC